MKKELRFGFALMAAILVALAVFMPWTAMTNGHYGLLMLALIVVTIMLGFPTAFTLMGMGVFFAWLSYYSSSPEAAVQRTLDLMVQRAYAVMTNEVLLAIPLFIFMGYLVERANLIEKLFKSIHLAMARVPGSLAVATLITCTIFATATGIIGAVVTLMGLLAMPAMLRAGYDVRVTAGCITAGGCLGIMIPPSVLLIVYGATAGVSVVDLYAGAFFPGLLLASLYILAVILLAFWKPSLMPPLPLEERVVTLSAAMQKVSTAFGTRALPALVRALKGRTNIDVPLRVIARNLFFALVPALTWFGIMAVVYRTLTLPEEVLDPSVPLEVPTLPSSYWVVFAVGTAMLVGYYWLLNFARFQIYKMLLSSFFPLSTLILMVLGSIVFGLATPTEASAAGAFGGYVLAALYFYFAKAKEVRDRIRPLWVLLWSLFGVSVVWFGLHKAELLPWALPVWVGWVSLGAVALWSALAIFQVGLVPVVRESAFLTARTSAMVCWLFVGSSIFSAAFALLGGQEIIEKWVLSLNMTPIQFMLLAQAIIFLLGWPLEWTEIIIIFMPIFVPLLKHFGIDPLFFGLLVALNLQTAFLSPPVAMAAFYLKGVSPPHVTLNQIFAGMMPFMLIQVFAMFLLYMWPDIGLWLPRVLYD